MTDIPDLKPEHLEQARAIVTAVMVNDETLCKFALGQMTSLKAVILLLAGAVATPYCCNEHGPNLAKWQEQLLGAITANGE